MTWSRDPRHVLIKEVWPDKLLYGTLLLVVSSAMGFLHAAMVVTLDVRLSETLAPWFENYPPILTAILSLGALLLALAAWRRLNVGYGVLAGIFAIASLSLFGIGVLHGAVAMVFLILARREGEDKTPPEHRVSKWEWPDKAFAASLLLLLAGITSVAWGTGMLFDQIAFGENSLYWGIAQVASGLIAIVASEFLYHQRAPHLGILASVFCAITLGGYVISPGLAMGALVAVFLAIRENEFTAKGALAPPSLDPPRS